MTFDSASLLRRLQALQQQVATSARYCAALREALATGDQFKVQRAAADAEQLVRTMAVTTARLRARVVPVDGLGDALESLSELVLRAQRLVVLAELTTLGQLVSESAAEMALMLGVHAELNWITDQWYGWRGAAAIERDAYRSALHGAHAAMRELGTTSEFGRFLDDGLNRAGRPSVQSACARALVALTISIDVEPDLPVPVVTGPRWERMS